MYMYECEKGVIPSALNYTGGKYKLLPQILPLFPADADKVVDLFCGGCNVGINVNCGKVQFNDSNRHLIGLLDTFRKLSKDEIFEWLYEAIGKYHLSLVSKNGYAYYGCESSRGLGNYNKGGYCRLRFNQRGEFNLPVGKRDFNAKMQKKLEGFLERIKSGDYSFTNRDFREIKPDNFTNKSFFYVDPPYLITCATYNEQAGWTEKDEYDLLFYLEQLDKKGIRFALSNVLESKGRFKF